MYKQFYKDGFCQVNFGGEKLDQVLTKILKNDLKDGYNLESKYLGSYDLRPDVLSYDKIFIESLRQYNIKKIIEETTLKNYSLFHIQIRVVENTNSYMDWHRDTYYDQSGELHGKSPHGVKLIYYPELNKEKQDRLLYLRGSNRILFPNNLYDRGLFKILESKKVKSNKDKAILFDTNGLHSVCPETKNNKSIRLIYSFLSKKQILDDHNDNKLHMKTIQMFEEI